MYKGPRHILSENRKTGWSIDLPLKGHCRPTPNCSKACYAKRGPQSWPLPVRKHLWMSQYLAGPDISRLIDECRHLRAVRLSGSGDLLEAHVPNLISLAKECHKTRFWGMTRKVEIAQLINNARLPNLRLLVTVDPTSTLDTWNHRGKLCFGPRHPQDRVPRDSRILAVFPAHYSGRVESGMTRHQKDCPGVWHETSGCLACGRCFSWW